MSVVKPNMTVEEIRAAMADLEGMLEQKLKEEKKAAKAEIEAIVKRVGVSLAELFPDQVKWQPKVDMLGEPKRKRAKAAVKYQHGEHTWTGQGKTPRWLDALEKAGRNREEFKV